MLLAVHIADNVHIFADNWVQQRTLHDVVLFEKDQLDENQDYKNEETNESPFVWCMGIYFVLK